MKVKKRDKTIETFQVEKLINATQKAFNSCGTDMPIELHQHLEHLYDSEQDITIDVEEIQDTIEDLLMKEYPSIAKCYIIYRYNHKVIRESRDKLMKGITKKLMAEDIENQNANVDEHSFGGRMGEASRMVTKDYALNYCMSRKSRNNHLNNEIYIHDLDSYAIGMHNCLTIPFDELLANGFKTKQADVRPANSINTALQLVAVIFQLQSLDQFGGVACGHLDWTLEPYVKKSFLKHFKIGMKYLEGMEMRPEDCIDTRTIDDDFYQNMPKVYSYAMDMTQKELKQGIEGLYHNLNTLQSRSGNQLPFTSLNYGTCTSTEGRMVIKALLEGSIEGVGKYGRTSIFPCGIFQLMKGINRKEGEPNYDLYKLALKSTSQRLYPNYVNCDWSGNEGYDKNDYRTYASTMGK